MSGSDGEMNPPERLRRWRLLLGESAGEAMPGVGLSGEDQAIDRCLGQLYGDEETSLSRRGGLGRGAPNVARWLGDIRKYFPVSVVRVMQKDAAP